MYNKVPALKARLFQKYHHATWDQGDQGFPPEGEEEGRQERQDKEERRQCQVQGPLFSLPLHPEDHRQGMDGKIDVVRCFAETKSLQEKAEKLKQSLPPGLQVKELK